MPLRPMAASSLWWEAEWLCLLVPSLSSKVIITMMVAMIVIMTVIMIVVMIVVIITMIVALFPAAGARRLFPLPLSSPTLLVHVATRPPPLMLLPLLLLLLLV